MHPVDCGALELRGGFWLGGRPFQADLIEGEGKLALMNGSVGLALAGAAQVFSVAPLLGARLAEPVLGLEGVIAQLDTAAMMQKSLQAADRLLVLAGVAAAAGLGLQEQRRPPLLQNSQFGKGPHVLHFRPVRYERFSQALELTTSELIPGQAPLLKCRKEITREEAIKLWAQKRKEGWQPCEPQWAPPPEVNPPALRPAASMGATGSAPCF
jgi:hypothetical protein